ncbi:MAG: phenylalanine--tRNA ligase subunit alpha [Flavobacteriia bacterium]|nr:phenylalanine--tRNA ligase subunit alpha [Flavobacteriia bacterium]
MIENIEELRKEATQFNLSNLDECEKFRIYFLGSKGKLKDLFSLLKEVPADKKKEMGLALNSLKIELENIYQNANNIQNKDISQDNEIDWSRPGKKINLGSRHPIEIVKNEIISIFEGIGYSISDGPEIEDDFHNFTALNFPTNHPARDMQDTFFIEKGVNELALRTHTSSVQVRVMENTTPPIRTISPGRVYRNEAISARAHCFFHQIEGLYIDKEVSFADLKQNLLYFVQRFFGPKATIRLRPSYFPFTEPSAEVDVSCTICDAKGCNVCKNTGWLEILGCGMVDPNVLINCGINPEEYSGFAFGMGVERLTQLKYKVNDLRLYSENDIRFLSQFKSVI